ncbi:Bug family tripartite tricarboxylate transporter substrate binding protein [Rubritepida flocculans]|uniref:Bug family tripartite tricarboxylate transporter substrate binding protein n=1 Tax=Rubritepida flocculans TaxID=182403 RepID=UPI00056332C9|nr:tripartite tricarboxylate transporter substrate binding protein [Rubritepida flocculans]
MMHRRHLLGAAAGLLAAPALGPTAAQAQAAWPSRGAVRLVAQFPPGGLVDTVTRLVAPVLQAALGQNVVVENRAGAGGVIGTDHVAKAAPDGYTFLMTHASVMVYSAATLPTLPFDPINDFTHLGLLVEAPSVLIVRGDSPLRSFQDFLQAARTRPTRYGSSGIGSAPHMLGAMLTGTANLTQLDHAPYAGSAPAMRDLLGGHIETMIDPITTNVAAMQNGTLRALAISSPQRLPAFPDVPTFAELGFPSLVQTQWVGMSGPRGLPQPIAERMMQEIPKLVQNAAVLQRMTELQTLPRNPVPLGADFVRIMQTELAQAREVARRYNIQAAS